MNVVETWISRVLGLGALVWALGLLLLAFNGTLATVTGEGDLTRIYLIGAGMLALGVMSLLGRRWAGSLLALGSGVFGVAMILGSLFSVSFPWLWINLTMGFALLAPGIFLVVTRKTTNRRRRANRMEE